MGIMIKDPEIIHALTELAERMGTTKAKALHYALAAERERLGPELDDLFPRDQVSCRTYTL